jgi:hypothetical protein
MQSIFAIELNGGRTPDESQENPAPHVLGLDHIYLTVSDFARSERYYDTVMRALGFRKGDKAIAGDPHAHYFNPVLQLSIRPARSSRSHDPYTCKMAGSLSAGSVGKMKRL